MAPEQGPELSPREWAVLGAVAEGPTHGFALARLLDADGPLGRVWTVRRPDVYQALRRLVRLGLVAEGPQAPGNRGPARTIVTATPAGRRAVRHWLKVPVDHVRDVRSLLLLKLILLDRTGVDPRPLIEAQRDLLRPRLAALGQARSEAEGFERVLAEWRYTSYRATLDFLESVLRDRDRETASRGRAPSLR